MKNKLFTFLLLLFFGSVISCSPALQEGAVIPSTEGAGSVPTGGNATTDNVGTTVYKPKQPSLNIFPEFSHYITDDALTSKDSPTEESASVNHTTTDNLGLDIPLPKLWESVVVRGSWGRIRKELNKLSEFGEDIAAAMMLAGSTEITDISQTVIVDTRIMVGETVSAWEVEFMRESANSAYTRFYFRNQKSGRFEAMYVVKMDEKGNPVRGFFVFVNSEIINDPSLAGQRYVQIVFDFTLSDQNRLVVRGINHRIKMQLDYAFQIYQQCDAKTFKCTAEAMEIHTEPPLRELISKTNVRLDWNDDTLDVCMGLMDYSHGISEIAGPTYAFTGALNKGDTVEIGSCVLSKPYWGDHVFTESDFPYRHFDTVPPGGTPLKIYIDGFSKEGWNSFTSNQIDGWLKGNP